MNEQTSTTRAISVGDLYRSGVPTWLAPGTLARFVAGELPPDERERVTAVLAHSPAQAALSKLLMDLAPDSALLAAAASAPEAAHHRHVRSVQRHAVGHVARHHRGLRWLGVAAVLAMAIGLWGWHRVDVLRDAPALVSNPAAQSDGDTIFDSGMDGKAAVPPHRDEIFRASFNGSS
jgi:anti-sigma factor RsiW